MLNRLYFVCLALLLSFSACTLTATQEEKLNTQLGNYISSVNEGHLVESVALSHPAVVKHFKDLGDSTFVDHFQTGLAGSESFIENPLFVEMKEKGKHLQRKYEAHLYTESAEINPNYQLFAISYDGGDNWFFVPSEDYFDPEIKGFERLFEK